MQKISDLGLLGVTPALPPSEPANVAQNRTQAPLRPTRTLTLTEAQQMTAAPGAAVPRPPFNPPAVESPVRAALRARQDDGRQWITAARANAGNLPNGNYIWRDRFGKLHRTDVGVLACVRGRRNVLFGEPLKTTLKGRADRAAREVRSFSGGWNSDPPLLAVLRRLAAMSPEELSDVDSDLVCRARERLQKVMGR